MNSKYHAKKVLSRDGTEFDSKLEAKRWDYLRGLEAEGKIWELRRQVEYELVPRMQKPVLKRMKRKMKIEARLGENPITYVADFVYNTEYDGLLLYDPKLDSFNLYTEKGDMVPFRVVAGAEADENEQVICAWKGMITVVEDTKGVKTKDYIIKRKLMRYNEDIAIREIKKPYEEI